MPLEGKVIVVTGASRGVGLAVARRLLTEGAHVATGSRTQPPDEDSDRLVWIETDISRPEEARRLIDGAVARYGRLDALVNNAAVEAEGTVEQIDPSEWDHVMAVNLRGPFLAAKYAVPHLRAAGGGTIVNVASVDALWAEPALAAYCASKGGLVALTRAIAIDHGQDGIRCSCICPSYVATEMLEQYYEAQADPAGTRRAAEQMHPVGRISSPTEVASLAVWLVSDEASFASGQCFVRDGGLTAGHLPWR